MRGMINAIARGLVSPIGLGGISAAGFAMAILAEQSLRGLVFLAAVFLATAVTIWLATRRPVIGVLAAWLLVAASTAASAAKFKYMAVNLQVVDLGFYLRDPDLVGFLVTCMPAHVAGAAVFAAICVAILMAAWRQAPVSMVPRLPLAGLALAAIAVVPLATPAESRSIDYYNKKRNFGSSFFASFSLLPELLAADPLAQRLAGAPTVQSLTPDPTCSGGARPDIVLTLSESAFPPSLFPSIKAPPAIEASLVAPGDRLRHLRVEVFGGGTISSIVATLAGLPVREFGWKAPYLSSFLKGRLGASLPQRLKECGYETAVLSPLPFGFVDEGPFMTSIGVGDYHDYARMGWKSKQERDSVYFDAALKHIDRHRARGGKPLFLFIITMAAHSPYSFRFDPEAKVAGEPFGNGAEMDEFLRRFALARQDMQAFRSGLAARARARPLIFSEFGDHQPMATAELATDADRRAARPDADSVARLTYYAITGFHRSLAVPLPDLPSLDIGFLGATLLEAAGVPPGPVFRELVRLRDACGGRYAECPDRRRKEAYLKGLIAAGLLRL